MTLSLIDTFLYREVSDYAACILLPLLPIIAACYVTTLLCRLAHWRHHPCRWWFGPLSAGAACIAVVCLTQLGLSLHPGVDSYGGGYFLRLACIAESLFAVLPAELIVWHYRRTYTSVEHAS
jgi:hypothetical protein